jgi:sarcosine oxidase
MKHYSTIVIGMGAMGSATLYQLSKNSKNILGIDQFNPPHSYGSHSGESRITRIANGEGEAYVPLALRSNEIWKELEQRSGDRLLIQNGGIVLATEDVRENTFHGKPDFLAQTIAVEAIRQQFPQFNLVGSETAYYEYDAGYLLADPCIQVQLQLAKEQGAKIRTNEKVTDIQPVGNGVRIATSKDTYYADSVVVSPGPWISKLLPRYQNLFRTYRQVLYWWSTQDPAFLPENFPVFIWLFGKQGYYGFPAIHGVESGVKIGFDYLDTTSDPDTLERNVSAEETEDAYRKYIADRFPHLNHQSINSAVCMLTYTPDSNFIIDTLPGYPQIVIASPCSGGGFKHSAAIGQILSELATMKQPSLDISTFSMSRFDNSQLNGKRPSVT